MPRARHLNPVTAIADLVAHVREGGRHHLYALAGAVLITAFIVGMFVAQFNRKPEYVPPEITYVKQLDGSRSRAEIQAQQARDLPAEQARRRAEAAAAEERKRQFDRVAKMMGI